MCIGGRRHSHADVISLTFVNCYIQIKRDWEKWSVPYDRLGSRPKFLGHIELKYDTFGNRLKYIINHRNTASARSKDDLIIIFFILYEKFPGLFYSKDESGSGAG